MPKFNFFLSFTLQCVAGASSAAVSSSPSPPSQMISSADSVNIVVKKEVASVLRDVPNFSLPLFKFREMFENRYRHSISCSDLYKMTDVVSVSGGYAGSSMSPASANGRTITLLPEWQLNVSYKKVKFRIREFSFQFPSF